MYAWNYESTWTINLNLLWISYKIEYVHIHSMPCCAILYNPLIMHAVSDLEPSHLDQKTSSKRTNIYSRSAINFRAPLCYKQSLTFWHTILLRHCTIHLAIIGILTYTYSYALVPLSYKQSLTFWHALNFYHMVPLSLASNHWHSDMRSFFIIWFHCPTSNHWHADMCSFL